MLKNENGKVLLPVSFIVPRKNMDVFQADLYPPTPGVDAALVSCITTLEKQKQSFTGADQRSITSPT